MLIEHDNLVIRTARKKDAPLLGKWWRDGKVMAHAGFPRGLAITDAKIAADLEQSGSRSLHLFIIEVAGQPVGEMSYRNKDNLTAELGVKICESTAQGQGYGPRFLSLLISKLFFELGFSKIITNTNLVNIRAQHVYEKIGFKKNGIDRDCWRDQLGQLQSAVNYELSKNDWPEE